MFDVNAERIEGFVQTPPACAVWVGAAVWRIAPMFRFGRSFATREGESEVGQSEPSTRRRVCIDELDMRPAVPLL